MRCYKCHRIHAYKFIKECLKCGSTQFVRQRIDQKTATRPYKTRRIEVIDTKTGIVRVLKQHIITRHG